MFKIFQTSILIIIIIVVFSSCAHKKCNGHKKHHGKHSCVKMKDQKVCSLSKEGKESCSKKK